MSGSRRGEDKSYHLYRMVARNEERGRRDKDLGDSGLVMAVLTRTDRGGTVKTTEASIMENTFCSGSV